DDAPALRAMAAGPRFAWQLAATTPAGRVVSKALAKVPHFFGASSYHLDMARDAGFTDIVIAADLVGNSFTLPFDLDIAREYFWRVNASNQCGASPFSSAGSFLVGACFEGWTA